MLVKLVGAATLLGVLIIITRSTGLAEYLNPGEMGNFEDWIEGLGPAAPLIFIAVYAAAAVAFLPGTPLTLIAGLAFGPFWGTVWALTGAIAGATLAFLSGRYVARDAVESWAEGSERLRQLDEKVERQGWRILVVTRLVPLFPFNLQNYAYGVTRIKLGTYVTVSAICMTPGVAIYAFAGGSLTSGGITRAFVYLGIAAVFFVLVSMISTRLKKRLLDQKED
ncbi:TVP38/TMEM64 family protein [Rubrobacter indicoceani]|uniref:TVP38/TMEM64 family protein n=1 Tax=Rubrobacter indicoceani TaxID=2051957 RepID=UPI0013C402A5|nr:TVP38/TMEM64 family protein [Rubrobacter indicoceani]